MGITRAMEELVMTSWGKESPFLEELGNEGVLRESAARRMKREAHQLSLFELDPKFGGL